LAKKTEFPERASPDNTDGYLVVQRNVDFLRDQFDGKFGQKYTVTGSRGGNLALQSLLTALVQLGLINDSTTA